MGVGARSRNEEGLVQRIEGDIARRSSKEWQLAGDIALDETVQAFLFAFLANDTRNTASQCRITVFGEYLDDILQGTENDGSEGASQLDRGIDVRYWESVSAGLDWLTLELLQGPVGIKNVKLLLL